MICVVVLLQLLSIIGIQAIKPDLETIIAELVRKQHDQQMYIQHLEEEIQDLKKTARKQQKLVSRNTDMVTNLQASFVEQRGVIERLFGIEFGEEEGRHHNGQQSGNDTSIPSVKASNDNLNSTQTRKREALNQLIRARQISFAEPGTAFYAYMPVDELEPGPDHTLIFRSVVTNMGNHYNQHNGMFTCPGYGVYAFSWTIVVREYIGTQLVVNSESVGATYTTAYQVDDIRTTTGMVIVEVNQGDVVYIRVNSDPLVHHKGDIHSTSYYKTSFCGWKLF